MLPAGSRGPSNVTASIRTDPSTELRTTFVSGCTSRTADAAAGADETASKASLL